MMGNRASRRALDCLTHPLSLIAMTILALNALVLQPFWPSWWSGKVGDAAWMLFVPFLVALPLSWLIPRRLPHQEKAVGLAGVGVVGLGFVLVKTVPTANAFLAAVFAHLAGRPAKLALDPTDLLVLPALLGAWLLWDKEPRRSAAQPLLHALAVLLAVVVTAADATSPRSMGVVCLLERGDAILAVEQYYDTGKSQSPEWLLYRSDDGGATWTAKYVERMSSNPCINERPFWPMHDEANRLNYSFVLGEGIYVTRDGELASRAEYTLTIPVYDASIHHRTGNALFAVGASGVLVRTPAGQWTVDYVTPHVVYVFESGPHGTVARIPVTPTPLPTRPTATPKPTKPAATQRPTATPTPIPTPTEVREAAERGVDGRYYLWQYTDRSGQPLVVGIPSRTQHAMVYYEYQMVTFYSVVMDRPQARTITVVDRAGNAVHQYGVWALSVAVYDPGSKQLVPRELIVWGQNGTGAVAVGTLTTVDGQLNGNTGSITGDRSTLLGRLAPGTPIGVAMAYGITFEKGYSWQSANPFPGIIAGERFIYFYRVLLGGDPERQLDAASRLASSWEVEDWLAGKRLPPTAIIGDASNPGISYISRFQPKK